MLKSLKQLFADLQDKSAGSKISQWPVKTPLLLWTKFYAVFVAIVTLSIIYSLVYFVPQIPKAISDTVPEVRITSSQNTLNFSPDTPVKLFSPDGSFVIDTREIPEDYSSQPVGVFIFRTYSEVRDKNGVVEKYNYQNLPAFSVSRTEVIHWFTTNKTKIILVLIPAILLLSVIFSGLVWGLRVLGFYIWAGVMFLGLKAFRKELPFKRLLPIVIYASILPLLISYVLFFAPHPLLNILNLALYVYFVITWSIPLVDTSKRPEIKAVETVRRKTK